MLTLAQKKAGGALVVGLVLLAWLGRARAATPAPVPSPGITLPPFFRQNGQCRRRFQRDGAWFTEEVSNALCDVYEETEDL